MSAGESEAKPFDPYELSPHDIQEPPTSLWAALRKIGPGIVLAGSIVGSGELILTTKLGAEYGYLFLWLILYSCVIKVFVQVELGRYAISSGLPTLAALNDLPGPRFRTHLLLWLWFFMLLATLTQLAGMMGGVAQAVQLAIPLDGYFRSYSDPVAASKTAWVVVIALGVIGLLLSGGYRMIERLTTFLVVGVTAVTVLGVIALQVTPYALRLDQIATGLMFAVPAAGIASAFSCFGITGVGTNELYYYPYWCIEKGYARWTGPRDDSEEWTRRAKGWLRVLYLDAWVSMLVFTAATLSFYFLGAAVLHPQVAAGTLPVPKNAEMVPTLSEMYVPSFGAWTRTAFLVGVWAVLFKTVYVSVAGHSRLTTDFFGLAKFVSLPDMDTRRLWIRGLCVFYPLLAVVLYVVFTNPTTLMEFGAAVQAANLPIISCAALYLRYFRLDKRLAPTPLSDGLLIFAVVSITVVATYAVVDFGIKNFGPPPTASAKPEAPIKDKAQTPSAK